MDEFGLDWDDAEIHPGTPARARDRFYRMVFQMIEDSARAGAPIAGANFWAWGGEGSAQHPDGMWKIGDSFVGDAPQEPQGRNSVFVSDTSTLRTIAQHAQIMRQIGSAGSPIALRERRRQRTSWNPVGGGK